MTIGFPVNETVTVAPVAVSFRDALPNCALVVSSAAVAPVTVNAGRDEPLYTAYATGTTFTGCRLAAPDTALMMSCRRATKYFHWAGVVGWVSGNTGVEALV